MSPRPMTSGEEAVWATVFARKFQDSEANSPHDLRFPSKDKEYAEWHRGIVREAAEHASGAVDALRHEVRSGAIRDGHGSTSNTTLRAGDIVDPAGLDLWDFKSDGLTLWVLHAPYPDQTWRGLEKCCMLPLEEGTLQPVTYGPPYAVPVTVNEAPILFETPELAAAFAAKHDCVGMVPVPVRLTVPFVRRALDTLKGPS